MERAMKLGLLAKYILVIVLMAVVLLPFFVMVLDSFKPYKELLSGRVTFLPGQPTLRAYRTVLIAEGAYGHPLSFLRYLGKKVAISLHFMPTERSKGIRDFPQYFINSLVTSLGASALAVAVASLAGYGMARYRFTGRNVLARSMLFIYVFPTMLLVVPIYKMFARIDVGGWSLLDSHYGLMIIYAAIAAPFLTWLLQSFFESIPREIEEAAEVDGAGGGSRFLRITLPLAAPGLITAAIYGFVTAWGEYLFAAILISSGDNKTGPVGLTSIVGTGPATEWENLLAGGVVITLPVILFFFPIARYFVRGFMAGAIKE
jgi:ABC-type glycerol-3-phosphate transport system permease component